MAGPVDEHDAPLTMAQARAQREVWQRMIEGMRRPWMTIALLVAIGFVHLLVGLLMLVQGEANLAGVLVADRPTSILVSMGAMYAPAIRSGEIWRWISAVFLHGGGMHLMLNGVALYGLGRLCEAVYGPIRFLWLILVTGICGGILSFVGGNVASVGASGSIFGLMGACIVFGFRYRAILPTPIGELFRKKLLPWVGLNLFIGAVIPFIDNLGHLGGLISGAVMALLISTRMVPNTPNPLPTRIAMGVGSGLLLLAALIGVPLSWVLR